MNAGPALCKWRLTIPSPSRPSCFRRYTGKVSDLGKMLIVVGALIAAVGLALVLFGKTNIPLGRLPGDIYYRGKNTTFYFPLATSLLLSVVLSLVLYVVSRFRR